MAATGKQKAKKGRSRPAGRGQPEWSGKSVAAFRDLLSRSVISPLNLVMLTRERIQESVDDAVNRGRMTRRDANDLVQSLVRRGRKQTDDVLSDLERLLGRGRDEIDEATKSARDRALQAAVRARRQVESATKRARRVSTTGTSLPIPNYDRLTASDVQKRLVKLNPAQLRKIRDYESRNGKRKSVLGAVSKKLG